MCMRQPLFPDFGYCEYCNNEHRSAVFSEKRFWALDVNAKEMGFLVHRRDQCLIFLRTANIVFPKGWTNQHSYQQWIRVIFFFPTSYQHWLLFIFVLCHSHWYKVVFCVFTGNDWSRALFHIPFDQLYLFSEEVSGHSFPLFFNGVGCCFLVMFYQCLLYLEY